MKDLQNYSFSESWVFLVVFADSKENNGKIQKNDSNEIPTR